MKSNLKNISIITVLSAVFFLLQFNTKLNAQSLRSLVNEGVEKYDVKKYNDSEVNFKKGIEKDPNNFNVYFNLGDAQYKQKRYDEAVKTYKQALSKTVDKDLKARTFHNIGNAYLKSEKISESIDAYKNALKINPGDLETKYNLSYALKMQKNQQQQNQNNKNKNDKNKDKQNQNDKNNQDNKDQNKDQNKQDQQQSQQTQQDNTKQQDKQSKPKEDKNKMSKEEAERILNALKNNELELQKQLRKHEGKRNNPEQDW